MATTTDSVTEAELAGAESEQAAELIMRSIRAAIPPDPQPTSNARQPPHCVKCADKRSSALACMCGAEIVALKPSACGLSQYGPYAYVAVGRVGSTTASIEQRLVWVSSSSCHKRAKMELLVPVLRDTRPSGDMDGDNGDSRDSGAWEDSRKC